MCTKNTRELEEILENTHTGTYDQYCRTYENSLLSSLNPFGVYLKECLKNNHITQQQTFLQAQIPEGYGYKLLSGEKKTRQRDVILRICYAHPGKHDCSAPAGDNIGEQCLVWMAR